MSKTIKAHLGARGRAIVKSLWISCLSWTGLIRLARLRIARKRGIVVLTFHRVLPESEFRSTHSPHGMLVTESTFEALARYVSQHYSVISLGGQHPAWDQNDTRPRLAFTFDDGWIDNFSFAAPIARKYNIPFSVFICPSKIGLPMPYWPEQVSALFGRLRSSDAATRAADTLLQAWAKKRSLALPSVAGPGALESLIGVLKPQSKHDREELLAQMTAIADRTQPAGDGTVDSTMTWQNVQALQAAGMRFGAHTNSHEILPHISLTEAEHELAEGKRAIEEKLGSHCSMFAYPNGDWSPQVRDLVRKAGYQLAFTNKAGIWTEASDPFLIPRANIWEGRLVGPSGRFSANAFEYATFWWASRNRSGSLQDAHRNDRSETVSLPSETANVALKDQGKGETGEMSPVGSSARR